MAKVKQLSDYTLEELQKLTPEELEALNQYDVSAAAEKAKADGHVAQDVSLPPYWRPFWDADTREGNGFLAQVLPMDRSGDFDRYELRAKCPLIAFRGPADDAERVIVLPGRKFTCSAYSALPLNQYYGLTVFVQVRNRRMLPASEVDGEKLPKRPMFEFDVTVPPEDHALLEEEREESDIDFRALRLQARDERRRLRAGAKAGEEVKEGQFTSEDDEVRAAL